MTAARRFLPLLFGLTCVLVLASACASDGRGDAAPTPSGTQTPLPEPTITGTSFIFPGRGYRVEFPDGWTPDANSVHAGPLIVDVFFGPEELDGVQSNISVTCEHQTEPKTTTDQFVQNRQRALHAAKAIDLTEDGAMTVAGQDWSVLSYGLEREDVRLHKTEVLLAGDECAWTLAFTAAESAFEQERPKFQAFLDSFEFISPGTANSSA